MTTCGISHPFGQLFPTSGQVTYALLSRPPLTTRASPSRPFDLHVSCTPPAFILSQDQTLRKKPTLRSASDRGSDHSHTYRLPATLHLLRCSRPVLDGTPAQPNIVARLRRGCQGAHGFPSRSVRLPGGEPTRPAGRARRAHRVVGASGPVKRVCSSRAGVVIGRRGRANHPATAPPRGVRWGSSPRAG
jgi:hypothetical protein